MSVITDGDLLAPALPRPLTFAAAQAAVMANKRGKGFNTTDVETEFGYLLEEIAELHRAWRQHRARRPSAARRALARLRIRPLSAPLASPGPVRDELADVLLFALGLAAMLGLDAGHAVETKIRINAQRAYRQLPNGTRVRHAGRPA